MMGNKERSIGMFSILGETIRIMGRNFKSLRADITLSQFQALLLLSKKSHCSVTELANHLMITLATTTRILDSLEKKGYIQRERDHPSDRRYVVIQITEEGHAVLEKVKAQNIEMMDKILDEALSDEEVEILKLLLRKFLNVAKNYDGSE
jgi:DNA-binding MarR family transcriptional regulator